MSPHEASALEINTKVIYYDRVGRLLKVFTNEDIIRLEYGRKENEFGSLYLDVPDLYGRSFFQIDGRLEVWRSVGAYPAYLDGECQWFIRLIRPKVDGSGRKIMHLLAYDGIHLLNRRVVAYDIVKNSSDKPVAGYSYKVGAADTLMEAIVRENYFNLATDTTRQYSSTYFDVIAVPGTAQSVTKEFAWRKTLPLLQDLAKESTQKGTYLCFDVVRMSEVKNAFRVYLNQRGMDRRTLLTFSLDRGNISYISAAYDHINEFNFIYVGAELDGQKIRKTASNTSAVNLGPYSRIEDYQSAGTGLTENAILEEATFWLRDHLGRIAVNAHVIQTPNCLFGIHYDYGDFVKLRGLDNDVDVHLDSYHVVYTSQGEKLDIYARNLDDTEY